MTSVKIFFSVTAMPKKKTQAPFFTKLSYLLFTIEGFDD